MIIKEVIGENVLKYSSLKLTNLPKKGLISVSGKNESGKTSIGEMVCFGLFGRTFSHNSRDLKKLIKWGNDSCSVMITFTAKDDKTYRVVRHLDLDTVHGAQLFTESGSEPLLTGGDSVSEAITDLIGFQYDEYVESFYLAQRELRTPSSDGNIIKVMAGISPLAELRGELEGTRKHEQLNAVATEDFIEETEEKIEELNYDEQRLSELENMAEKCKGIATAQQGFVERCSHAVTNYQDLFAKVKKLKAFKVVSLLIVIVTLAISLEFFIVWWWIDHPHQLGALGDTLEKISEFVSGGNGNFLLLSTVFLICSILGCGLFVFLTFRARGFKDQTGELIKLLQSLKSDDRNELQSIFDQSSILVKNKEETGVEKEEIADIVDQGKGAEGGDERLHSEGLESLQGVSKQIATFQIEPQALGDVTREDLLELESLCNSGFAQVALLEKECEQERQLGELAAGYHNEIAVGNQTLTEKRHRIQVVEAGIDLLGKGIGHMSRRFNTDVLKYTVRAIPLFTNGHYEHLKIDDQMNVRVFSSDKHDFMGFEELSSGTQRQILLALRLAMSQKLMQTAATSNQYIFFDEPFAFFDKDRIHSTLHSLPDISQAISQIWIVAQELDKDAKVDVDIRCDADNDELVMDCRV